jgi:hypothetical protein
VLKGSERVTTREVGISSESALVFCCCDVSCDSRQGGEPGIRCKKGWGTLLECNGAKTACKKVNVRRHDQENRTGQKRRRHQNRWDHGITFIYDQSTQNNDRCLGVYSNTGIPAQPKKRSHGSLYDAQAA